MLLSDVLEEPRAQRRPREGRVPLRRARLRLVERHRAAVGQRERDAWVENKAGVTGQPEHLCQLAEAGRGWPRLEAAPSVV